MRLLLASLLLFGCTAASAGTPLPDAPHVVASGQGKASVKPDQARVRFDFEQRAPRPLAAKQAVDAAVNRLLGSLDAYGIADDDITASSLDASEDVDYDDDGRRTSNGFVASRSVTVLLKDIDRLNDFLDNGLASGAHGIGGVGFESARKDALRAQARQQAVADARAKAEEMAIAFGARLGPVYSIGSINSRSEDQYGANTLDRIQVTGSRMPRGRYVQPEVEYAETVNAVFELQR
jgi:uncharacterized protein